MKTRVNLHKFSNKTNNSDMESLYFLIPLFFVIIMVFPLSFRIKFALDSNKKQMIVSAFLWKLKLITIKLCVKNNKIYLITKQRKKEIELKLSIKEIYFVESIGENLKDKTTLRKLEFCGKVGLVDAKDTAVITSSILIILKSFFAYIKNYKPTCSMSANIEPNYNSSVMIICGYASFTITIFDLLFSLIISLFSLRSKAYGKRSKLS